MSNHPNQSHAAAPTVIKNGTGVKKVNILAMGSSRSDFEAMQLMETPPDLMIDAELWGINYIGAAKRVDRLIHVDPVHPFLGHYGIKRMLDMSLKDNIPFYTSAPHPMYPNHVLYPWDKITQAIGITYLNGSVSAAVAMAMAEGYTDIGLFGCDFSYPEAHLSEAGRANVEFLMGIGSQRGIRFAVASSSTLLDMFCQQQPYGFWADPNVPPGSGGKLLTVPQIYSYCERFRNGELKKFATPVISVIRPSVPKNPEPMNTIEPEHTVPAWQITSALRSQPVSAMGGPHQLQPSVAAPSPQADPPGTVALQTAAPIGALRNGADHNDPGSIQLSDRNSR